MDSAHRTIKNIPVLSPCVGEEEKNSKGYSPSNSARGEAIHFSLLFINSSCICVIMVDVCVVLVHVYSMSNAHAQRFKE